MKTFYARISRKAIAESLRGEGDGFVTRPAAVDAAIRDFFQSFRAMAHRFEENPVATFQTLEDENGVIIFRNVDFIVVGVGENTWGDLVIFTANGFSITVVEGD